MNTTENNLIFESYVKNKAQTRDLEDEYFAKYGELPESQKDLDEFEASKSEEDAEGPPFPSLQKGQKVYVDLTDGSELRGVLDFDGVDLARSNMFTIDGGEEIGVEDIVDVGPIATEDAESGGVVYVVESDAEYEDTQVHGIFTDFETAKKYAAEVELLPGFWVGIMEMPLNKPEAQGKYHRLS